MGTIYCRFFKRPLDILLAALGLAALSPFLLAIAVFVRLTSPGPAFFLQTRTGRFGRPFKIIKFRSMKSGSSGPLLTAAGDSRITPLGRWLRRSKVDELPQLFNVLLGHMSFVGPRPEVPMYTARYTLRQLEVLLVRPGITCPDIQFDEEQLMAGQPDKESFYLSAILPAKLDRDLAYSRRIRFSSDIRIILHTAAGALYRAFPSRTRSGSAPLRARGNRSASSVSADSGL
jgi:lipopolysaccharide/colanic/teichoic acid biosynthesis glycosyltransferase